ncbi:MAG: hypothetical protein ACFE0Q_08490 [Anaerolineae bacterium]
MRILLRGILLSLFLTFTALPVLGWEHSGNLDRQTRPPTIEQVESDSAIVRVIPSEAVVGSEHVILVTGLQANEPITVRIINEANSNTVYQTQQNANERGVVEVEIFTETDDELGTYRVEAVNASDRVIGSNTLTILEAEVFNRNVSISPLEGNAGTLFTVEISGVRPFVILEVVIEDAEGNIVFDQRQRASVDGLAIFEFDSTDLEGELTVEVIEGESEIIATETLTVIGEVFPTTIVIEPAPALPGETVFVTISGIEPETDVTVDIVLNGETIEQISETANISGLVIFPYSFTEDSERGTYELQVFADNEQIGEQALRVDVLPVSVNIEPPVGTVGTVFIMTISDLRPDEDVQVDFIRDDEVVQTRTARADENGEARVALGQRLALEIGFYRVEVQRLGEVVLTQTVEVASERPQTQSAINPDDVNVSVTPESGPVPTVYTVTVSGLPADTNLTMFILFEGSSIFSFSGTSDAEGVFNTEITSEESDPPGIYTLEVRAEGEVIGSTDFEIADASAEETPEEETPDDTPPSVEGDVVIDITPTTLRQGERIEFIIRNLNPDETVTFELLFEGEVIYSTEATANATGASGVALVARDDEALGQYDVRVVRDGEIITSNSFTIVPTDAEVNNASIRIVPESGAQGTSYTITVAGLNADETIDVSVTLDEENIFTSERTANAQGIVTIVLNSDAESAVGTYAVTVTRASGDIVEASLTINEGETTDEEVTPSDESADDATISVDPLSGDVGTEHVISVSGLNAEEALTLRIEFDGEDVYSAERRANTDGTFSTVIVADPDDPAGEYTVIIERTDGEPLSTTLTVTAPEPVRDATLTITPDEVDEQEPFEIVITDLNANEIITLDVVVDGDVLFETERTADAEGTVSLFLATDEGDPIGTYSIVITRADGATLSADVQIIGEPTEEEPAIDEAPDDTERTVQLSVTPNTGTVETAYEFFASGLGSNQAFEVLVSYDGEEVFRSARSADASGFFSITLEADEGDPLGTYTFSLIAEDGAVLASVDFEVLEDETDAESITGDDDDNLSGEVIDPQDDDTEDAQVEDGEALEPMTTSYAEELYIVFDEEVAVQEITFDGQAGDVISVRVDSGDTLDTVARLLTPDGVEIALDDDGGLGFDPEMERVPLPLSGRYTLEVVPFNPGDTGEAYVTITRDDVRTLDQDASRVIVLNSKITTDILTFEGDAGEVVSLILDLTDGAIGDLTVHARQGNTELMHYQTFGLPRTVILGFVVPEDGTVVIQIEDDGSNRAELNGRIDRE